MNSAAGVLLLLIGAVALVGFLTGNLDRWMAYLFDPSRPALSPASPAPKVKPDKPANDLASLASLTRGTVHA